MGFEDLKKGDRLVNVQYGYGVYNAKVIGNKPNKKMLIIKVYNSWLYSTKVVCSYDSYYLVVAEKRDK